MDKPDTKNKLDDSLEKIINNKHHNKKRGRSKEQEH